ncbi:hypothetical protein [Saccharomonospora sp. CUA-673]|uniref:hypothetical protein n=1 Tax=Saccharomonospora sp. CUA-673 TaxID=1904969 RepID=UPI0021014DFA|nr:hypothetical protein [Saccharomonospora sp. CUA-673]
MKLELSEDQKLLFETVDSAVGRGYAGGGREEATTSERGWNDAVWTTLAEMGIAGLAVSEKHGGAERVRSRCTRRSRRWVSMSRRNRCWMRLSCRRG